jgi:hypothetical protein
MYTDQLAIVGTISEKDEPNSYLDMLTVKGIEYTVRHEDSFTEVSPRQYQLITDEMEGKVSEDMLVRTGHYQGEGRRLYFVEFSINLGKNVWNHTTLVYDQEPSPEDMKVIMSNYQNLIVHEDSEEVIL